MLEEHLTCPKCSYDLHGIPEVRCPECGFRYDAAALRSMSASAEWTRLAVARHITVRAAIAAGLAVPSVCASAGIPGWPRLIVFVATYVAVFWIWVVLTDAYQGPKSISRLIGLFAAIFMGFGLVLFENFLALVAGAVLAMAWSVRLRDWPELPPMGSVAVTETRRLADRMSGACTASLFVATLLLIAVLFR